MPPPLPPKAQACPLPSPCRGHGDRDRIDCKASAMGVGMILYTPMRTEDSPTPVPFPPCLPRGGLWAFGGPSRSEEGLRASRVAFSGEAGVSAPHDHAAHTDSRVGNRLGPWGRGRGGLGGCSDPIQPPLDCPASAPRLRAAGGNAPHPRIGGWRCHPGAALRPHGLPASRACQASLEKGRVVVPFRVCPCGHPRPLWGSPPFGGRPMGVP